MTFTQSIATCFKKYATFNLVVSIVSIFSFNCYCNISSHIAMAQSQSRFTINESYWHIIHFSNIHSKLSCYLQKTP